MTNTYKHVHCNDCNVLVINGVICHEAGCPSAYKDQKLECKWCGNEFTPEYKGQECCSSQCYADYWGIPYDEETGEFL